MKLSVKKIMESWILLAAAVSTCLTACRPGSNIPQITGQNWLLVEVSGSSVELAGIDGLEQPSLLLDKDTGQASGSSGLNRFFCAYTLEGWGLKFGMTAGTRRAGPPEAMAVEDKFLQALAEVDNWLVEDGRLVLRKVEQPVLMFTLSAQPHS